MELHEAVDKAGFELSVSVVGQNQGTGKLELLSSQVMVHGGEPPDYREALKPLVGKWGDAVGKKVAAIAKKYGDLGMEDDGDMSEEGKVAYDNLFRTEATDIASGVFALGYMLGDPKWDQRIHDAQTLNAALADRDTHKVLMTRFSTAGPLRERLYDQFDTGCTYISMVFSRLNVDHDEDNVFLWGKLATEFVLFGVFDTGLKTRRIIEEDATFAQITGTLDTPES